MEGYSNEFYEHVMGNSLASAREIVPLILELVTPQSVIDVGCGRGDWLSVFRDSGVQSVLGLDGDWVDQDKLLIPPDCFLTRELEAPLDLDETFSLALSLEVAEHLSRGFAESFISSLTALAPVVVFSAAIPFQGGTNHVNEQWPEYWADLFCRCGFVPVDCIRPRIWKNENVSWWYAQNLLIFADETYLKTNRLLQREYENSRHHQLSLVHPKVYLAQARQSNLASAARNTLSEWKRWFKDAQPHRH